MNVGSLVKISLNSFEEGFGIVIGWDGNPFRYGWWVVFYANAVWRLRKHHVELINVC